MNSKNIKKNGCNLDLDVVNNGTYYRSAKMYFPRGILEISTNQCRMNMWQNMRKNIINRDPSTVIAH